MDLERGLLSKLIDSHAIQVTWDKGIRGDVFEDPHLAAVFEFVITYWVENSMQLAPTRDVLRFEYPDLELPHTDESVTWLADKLTERYRTNQLQQILLDAGRMDDPREAIEMVFAESTRTKDVTAPRVNRINMADNVDQRRARYTDRLTETVRGAPIGLAEVDQHTGGIRPGEVAVMAGYAKTGKSFSLIKAACEAVRQGYTPYVASLEQEVSEFEDRIDAVFSGVGYGKLSRGQLTMAEVDRWHEGQDRLAAAGNLHVERPPRGERTVANLVNRARQVGADYLIIDQLSWLESRGRYRDRRDMYLELIQDLKDEVQRPSHPLPCLMAVQFNRDAVSTPGKRGGMHNIANAADIEQTVDISFGLYRNREIRANNSMVLDILGARRCDQESWLLEWHLEARTEMSVRGIYEDTEGGES